MMTDSFSEKLASYKLAHALGNIDNVSSIELINDIDNEKYTMRKGKSSSEIDSIADQLVECFANPSARSYYCKVAQRLSEATIWNNVEIAKRGRSPVRYFTWLCQKAMG